MGDDGSRTIDVRGDDEHQVLAKETRLVDEALRNFPPSVRQTVETAAWEQALLYLESDEGKGRDAGKLALYALRKFEEWWPILEKGELKRHQVTFQYENFTHAFCPEEAAAKGIWTKTFATAYRRTDEPLRC